MRIMFTELKANQETIREGLSDDQLIIFEEPLRREEILMRGEGVEVLSPFIYTRIDEELIDSLPDLKLIVTRSVGFDHIAARHALDRGIEVCHIPDYGAHVVAEHVFALLLSVARRITRADAFVKSGGLFDFEPFLGLELEGKTLGVMGTGKIGAEVIRIADGFNMKVIAHDIYQNIPLAAKYGFQYVSKDELLRRSDFITLHTPLTPETRHMIDEDAISKMKKDAILINASRGGVVDTKALRKALDERRIWGAGVDVLENEQRSVEDPILHAPNVTITPHTAFYTREALERIARTTVETIASFKKGEVINRVPVEYL